MDRTTRLVVAGLFALAVLLRLHDAWVALPLSGFDGPFHAANIGIMRFQGRLPLPDDGWFASFHPPVYYAVSALAWLALPRQLDPHSVLFVLRLVNVAAEIALAGAVLASARILIPGRPWVAVYAVALVLFIPMHMGPSFLIGNEILAAAFSAIAMYLLLRSLAEPRSRSLAALLGGVLGLAVLTKLSALVVVATCGVVLLLRAQQEADWRGPAFRNVVIVGLTVCLVSGWYFVRNVLHFGTPIVMQTEIASRAMKKQGYGPTRPAGDYLSFRIEMLLDPSSRSPQSKRSVWSATFASTWFDSYGTTLRVQSRWGIRFSRILFACGAILTVMTFVGSFALVRRRVHCPIPVGPGALFLLAFLTVASYVAFTYRVATFSALKGSYLSPALLAFAILSAVGLDATAGWTRHAGKAVRSFMLCFIVAATAISWVGWLAPLIFNPADYYIRAYRNAATQCVYEFFVKGRTPVRCQ